MFAEGLGGGHFCFIKIYSLVLNFDSLKDWKCKGPTPWPTPTRGGPTHRLSP